MTIDREYAVRLVEAQLARDVPPMSLVVGVREHELVWIVSYQSAEYVRTGDPSRMLAGGGPYLVDRVDGGLHSIGVVSAKVGIGEDDYRRGVRGMALRTSVDDLHDEVLESAGSRGAFPRCAFCGSVYRRWALPRPWLSDGVAGRRRHHRRSAHHSSEGSREGVIA